MSWGAALLVVAVVVAACRCWKAWLDSGLEKHRAASEERARTMLSEERLRLSEERLRLSADAVRRQEIYLEMARAVRCGHISRS